MTLTKVEYEAMFGLLILATWFTGHGQPDDAQSVVKRLAFGCHVAAVPGAAEDSAVRARLAAVDDRCRAFASRIPQPRADSLDGMVAAARWSYEGRLFAVATGEVAAEATRYVQVLRPCYEWEGFHDCPEREAAFADRYLTAHPASAFAGYLPLLAAHRWLCAAEAYDYERGARFPVSKTGVGGAAARRAFARDLAVAARSADPLVRFAAAALKRTPSCF